MSFSLKIIAPLALPGLIILGIYWNYSQLSSDSSKSGREQILDQNFQSDKLVSDLKKISQHEVHLVEQAALSPNDQNEILQKNFVLLESLYARAVDTSFSSDIEKIKLNVQANREVYSNQIIKSLHNAQQLNDTKKEVQVLGVASMLPIGRSPLYQESEKILQELAYGDRQWDGSLFKSAYQLFVTQSFFRQEDHQRVMNALLENMQDPKIKNEMKKTFDDINSNIPKED